MQYFFHVQTSADASLKESEDSCSHHTNILHPSLSACSSSTSLHASATSQPLQQQTKRSQVWKDLRRDVIKINNESVSGASEMGAENIIGALLRHVSDKVEIAKSQAFSPDIQKILNNNNSNSNNILSPPGVKTQPNRSNDFAVNLSEAEMLSFASDILMMSNRTQVSYNLSHKETHS